MAPGFWGLKKILLSLPQGPLLKFQGEDLSFSLRDVEFIKLLSYLSYLGR